MDMERTACWLAHLVFTIGQCNNRYNAFFCIDSNYSVQVIKCVEYNMVRRVIQYLLYQQYYRTKIRTKIYNDKRLLLPLNVYRQVIETWISGARHHNSVTIFPNISWNTQQSGITSPKSVTIFSLRNFPGYGTPK